MDILNASPEDEGWYTKVRCSKCGETVQVGALYMLLNLSKPILCEKCSKEEEHEQASNSVG